MHSIEISNRFHLARRIAKIVAPDFRIFTTEALQTDDCVLDMGAKTIEIGEGTREKTAIAAILFQLGHIRLRNSPEFQEHSGKIRDMNEKRVINKLVRQGKEADKLAAKWATEVLVSTFDLTEDHAKALVNPFCWSESDWKLYYSAN